MDWIESMRRAIGCVEENLTGELDIGKIAREAYVSPFYFQKAFAMLCGFTVGEYVRNRRLALAGSELAYSGASVIDVALKYGYDSPDSFAKAFVRFHGVTPSAVKKGGAPVKTFAPLKLTFKLEGGYGMDYKIIEKQEFTVYGTWRDFTDETSTKGIPAFWTEYYAAPAADKLCGVYGICVERGGGFRYYIADGAEAHAACPAGCESLSIPAHTWAVFPCVGPMPNALQSATRRLFSEWLPGNGEYELAEGLTIERYTDVRDYPKGNQDAAYYSEIWVPVKKK